LAKYEAVEDFSGGLSLAKHDRDKTRVIKKVQKYLVKEDIWF